MKIYHEIPSDLPPTALTIGTFDGVHIGHRAIFQTMRDAASHTTLLTFANHPFQIVRPHHPVPPILTPLPLKLALFKECGLDAVILIPFTQEIASLPYQKLLNQFPLTHLVFGEGASFGKNREGDAAHISSYAKKRSISSAYVPKVCLDGAPVSSSRIRSAIASGDLKEAASLLGRPHCLSHPATTQQALPPDGVYPVNIAGQKTTLEIRQRQLILPSAQNPTLISFDPDITLEELHV